MKCDETTASRFTDGASYLKHSQEKGNARRPNDCHIYTPISSLPVIYPICNPAEPFKRNSIDRGKFTLIAGSHKTNHIKEASSPLLRIRIFTFLLIFTVLASLALHTFPARAQPSYTPGVRPGDYVTYGEFSQNNTLPYAPPFPENVSMLKFQVQSVNGPAHTVNATFVFTYKNGTQSGQPLSGNTETGQGNLFPYLVAGNLTAGDLLLNTPNSFFRYVFNETVERVYAGAIRTVNLLNLTITYPQESIRVIFYWDTQTGLLLDGAEYANFTSPSPSSLALHFRATQTNVWSSSTNPDYLLDASSATTTILHAGESTSFRLDLASINSFTGTINIAASLPNPGLTHPPSVSVNPASLQLSTLSQTASAVLAVSTDTAASIGSYIITVNATSGSTNHQAMLLLVIAPPDFVINANPSNLTISQNSSKSSAITVTGRGGFTGTVLLAIQSQPFGTIVTANLSRTVVTLNSTTTAGTSTLSVDTTNSLPGTTTVYITATGGTISRNLYLLINVTGPDFRMTASPFLLTIREGQTGQSTITLTSVLGFSGRVNLSTSIYGTITAALTNSSISLTSGGQANTTLTVTVPSTTTPGFASVSVTGIGPNNLSHSAYIELNVTGPDFTLSASSTFFTLKAGQTGNSTLTLSARAGFSGAIILTSSSYSNLQSTLNPLSVTLNSTRPSSTALLTITVPLGPTPVHYAQVSVYVIGPDFSLSASPSFLVLPQGGSASSTISLTSIDNLNGTATMFVAFSNPIIVSPSSANVTLAANSTSTTSLKLSAPANAVPGAYYVHMTVYLRSVTHDLFISVQVTGPDFTLFASPASLTIQRGTTATSTIILDSLNGFNRTVSIGFSSYGLNVTPANANVTLTPSGIASVNVTIQAPTSTLPGSYYVSVNARSGFITHYTQIYVQVIGPDFNIQSNPYFLVVQAGGSGQSTILLSSLNGFNGNVTLTANFFVSGTNATLSPVNVTLTPQTVRLGPSATSTATLDIMSTLAAAGQNFTIYITATGNNETHYTQVYVSIIGPTFRLSSDHSFFVIPEGGSATATITTTSVDGFSGPVHLSVASYFAFNVSIAPQNITLGPGGSISSTLNITVPTGTASNWVYSLAVTGTGNGVSKSIYMTIEVIAPSFSLTVSPIFLSLAAGDIGHATVALTGFNGFSGTIKLSSSSSPTGPTTNLTPSTVTLNSTTTTSTTLLTINVPANATPGFYDVNINATANRLFENITVLVQVMGPDFNLSANPASFQITPGGSANSIITLSGVNGFNGTVHLFGAVSAGPGVTTSFSPVNVTLTPSHPNSTSILTVNVAPGTYAGPYVITIIGSLVTNSNVTFLVRYATVAVTVPEFPNFQMLVNTGLLSINQGSSGKLLLTLTSLNGFSGNVTITAQTNAQGITISPTTTMVKLPANSTVQTSLTIAIGMNTTTSVYSLALNATSMGISHPNEIEIAVLPRPDFTLTAGPSFQTIHSGDSSSIFVLLLGQDGFSDTVHLFTAVTPAGVSAVPEPATVQVLSNNVTEAMVIISTTAATSPGTYTISITANSTSGAHAVSVTVTVTPRPDFKLSSSASALIIQNGASATSTLSVSPVAGFTGSVTLSPTAPPGFATNFSINLITGGTGTSTLTITVGASVTAGSYTLTINGNSGSITHTTTINVTVTTSATITFVVKQASWVHRFSLSKNGSAQTFTLTVMNTGMSPAYIQLLAAGNSTNLKSFFDVESGVALLSPGASVTITLSQPFNATSIGLKFNFTVQLFYGISIDPSGTILNPHTLQAVKGSFTIVK